MGSRYSADDIREGLNSSGCQLWTWQKDEIDTVLITTVFDKTCLLLALAGKNRNEWLDCLPLIEDWARDNGCEKMLIHGRKAWSRILRYEIEGLDDFGLHIMSKQL